MKMTTLPPARSQGRSPRPRGKDWRAQLYDNERSELSVLDQAILRQKMSIKTQEDWDKLLALKSKRAKLQVKASQRHRRSSTAPVVVVDNSAMTDIEKLEIVTYLYRLSEIGINVPQEVRQAAKVLEKQVKKP